MANERQAYVFLFTDWHLQAENSGRALDEWKPFAQRVPPDPRSMRQIVEEINRRFDEDFIAEFHNAEKMRLITSGRGLDVIDPNSDDQPKWQKVWGIFLDRYAVDAKPTNQEKLGLLGVGVAEAMENREGSPVYLFVVPKGDKTIPDGIKFYIRNNFVALLIDQPDGFISTVSTLLNDSAQKLPKPVRDRFNKEL